ncbi:MAG: hypothetical protein QOH17_848, partial [Pseudonocardiales bacterium]|nr:hypothetical protein [Pseudonocardiales bacterium]
QEELAQLTQARRRWVERRAPLGQAVPGDGQALDAAETAVADAEQALREQFPESEFRRAVAEAAREVQRAAGRLDGHRPAAQARAAQLAQLPAANEPTLRAEVQKAAAGRAVTAGQGLGTAKSELADAKRELAANTPSDRPRHAQDLPIEPADRPDAQRLARDAIAEATRVQVKVGALERDRDAAKAAANSAHIRAGMLRDQGARLHGVEPAALAVGTISAEADEVRSDVGELSADLDEADGAYQNAASGRSRAIEGLRTWASADRFREVADDEHGQAVRRLRDLLRGDDVLGRVAPRAADLAEDLADRERLIAQQLNQVEAHKRNVVARLADLADEALSDLSRASSLSELPVGIGPWDGLRFLNVECRQRPNREQIGVRVSDLVDRMVAAGKIELDPVELLWRAVEAAAGADGFRATILKLAPDQPTGRTPVEGMRKWSGGENLTASLVLFCVMAKLRAEKRSGARSGATGGVVPLDNPLGKANYLPFLHLQRRVAAVNGVQLVFWTGVADIGAVTAFPRIAAMHKRPSASAPGRAYVRVDVDDSYRAPADGGPAAQVVDVVNTARHD